jgi:hypothetical protein
MFPEVPEIVPVESVSHEDRIQWGSPYGLRVGLPPNSGEASPRPAQRKPLIAPPSGRAPRQFVEWASRPATPAFLVAAMLLCGVDDRRPPLKTDSEYQFHDICKTQPAPGNSHVFADGKLYVVVTVGPPAGQPTGRSLFGLGLSGLLAAGCARSGRRALSPSISRLSPRRGARSPWGPVSASKELYGRIHGKRVESRNPDRIS